LSSPLVRNRRELRQVLENNLLTETREEELEEISGEERPEETRKRTKCQLIEANLPFSDFVSKHQQEVTFGGTEDSTLWNVQSHGAPIGFMDTANSRLWIFHSIGSADEMAKEIDTLIGNDGSMVDLPWFPSSSLEKIGRLGEDSAGFNLRYRNKFIGIAAESKVEDMTMRFWGQGALDVIGELKNSRRMKGGLSLSGIGIMHKVETGYAKETLASNGYILAMRGDSIDSHFSIISKIQDHYLQLLNLLENGYRFSYGKGPCGMTFSGDMLTVVFERHIDDMEKFVSSLFSNTQPFRLWGVARKLEPELFKVKGIDLHTGGRIDFEIEPNEMRLYLHDGSCGNVVTRLFTNLQSYFDSQSELYGHRDERII
jgi:hypothetical protein